ncbi:response regulator transcription factor [Micromonosporaceae bacterium B7E4]
MVRAGLGLILRSQPDIQVVGECDDGGQVVHAVSGYAPDLVCTDVRMPGVDGVEATRRLRAASGAPVCILDVLRLMARGASSQEIADQLFLAEPR